MSRSALGIFVAAAVVACGPPAGRLFHTTLTTPDGSYSLPVTLGDQTNLVVGLEPGPTEPFPDVEPTVRSDPADPKAMILTWLGGACEDESVVVFRPDGGRYDLGVSHRGGLFASCTAIGIFRAVRIRTSEPVAIDLIDVIGRPGATTRIGASGTGELVAGDQVAARAGDDVTLFGGSGADGALVVCAVEEIHSTP